MAMKQESSEDAKNQAKSLRHKYRIELHIYTNEWMSLTKELMEIKSQSLSLDNIQRLATKLMIMVTGHVKELATHFFNGMLTLNLFNTYMPCWKCYTEVDPEILSGGK